MNSREQIWCVVSEEISFETFTPIWSHVNENETPPPPLSATLVDTLSRSMHDILGVNVTCTFRGDVVRKNMKTKKKKIVKKFKKNKILKNKQTKNGLEIWWIGRPTCPPN